jgi:hypothetical protein
MAMNIQDYFAWHDYPKKDKLLQKTKPRNEREYQQQLRKYDLLQKQLEEFRDRRRRINDLFNLNKLIRGVKSKNEREIINRARQKGSEG